MALWYILIFLVGMLAGILYVCLSTSMRRRQPQQFIIEDQLDDVDEMMLWGMVADDPFYQGL